MCSSNLQSTANLMCMLVQGYIYLIDGVLLPSNNLAAFSTGGTATAPLAEAGESEGASVEGPAVATAG